MFVSNIYLNAQPNFQGVFNIIKTDVISDSYKKEKIINYYAVYHPYQNETKTKINQAMNAFIKKSNTTKEEFTDNDINITINKPLKHTWQITENYKCYRGKRLHSKGHGITIIG